MKESITLILFFFVFTASCNVSQTEDEASTEKLLERFRIMMQTSDENDITQKARQNLQNNSEILAYRYIIDAKPSQIEIDEELIELFYAGLVHIRNSEAGEPVSSINARGINIIHELIINFDENGPIASSWKEGAKETGIDDFDELMAEFDLTLGTINTGIGFGVLISERPYNMIALGKKFSTLPQITFAEPNGIVGDGNDITAEIAAEGILYTFKSGFGDCPSGCINEHFWVFSVSESGEVRLVEEFGNALPE